MTRYATHFVVLVLVIGVVLGGGFRSLTVHAAHDDSGFSESQAYLDAPEGASDTQEGATAGYLRSTGSPVTVASARVITYEVQAGDTIDSVAGKFNLDRYSVMGPNNIQDPEQALQPGQKLTIVPVSGMYHTVKEGQTLQYVATLYGVDPQAIIDYKPNGLEPPYKLEPGQKLVIPGGNVPPRESALTYKVKEGDTLSQIADKFGVDTQTLIWANNLTDENLLQPGQELVVLPVSGVKYVVKEGDTVASIAQTYDVNPKAITDYAPNDVANPEDVKVGQELIIPGGAVPTPTPQPQPQVASVAGAPPAPEQAAPVQEASAPQEPAPAPAAPAPQPQAPQPAPEPAPKPAGNGVATGHFDWPLSGRLTQYFGHTSFENWHTGIDIAPGYGTPIHASDGGKVIFAGWSKVGYGNLIIIDHGNGYQTYYAHQSAFEVGYGEQVSQGQVIGYVGSTGWSTGPHLHFEIRKNGTAVDPLPYLK